MSHVFLFLGFKATSTQHLASLLNQLAMQRRIRGLSLNTSSSESIQRNIIRCCIFKSMVLHALSKVGTNIICEISWIIIMQLVMVVSIYHMRYRGDSRFVPSQWETAMLCNDVSHWLDAGLQPALKYTEKSSSSIYNTENDLCMSDVPCYLNRTVI